VGSRARRAGSRSRTPDYGRLPTEQPNPRTRRLDRLAPLALVRTITAEDRRAAASVAAVARPLARAVAAVAAALRGGGRLIYAGAGTSGRLGVLDAAECPPTFGVPRGRVAGVIAGGRRALWRAVEGAEDRLDPLALVVDRDDDRELGSAGLDVRMSRRRASSLGHRRPASTSARIHGTTSSSIVSSEVVASKPRTSRALRTSGTRR